jgi:O-antigen/teichoic acid export membrane protein
MQALSGVWLFARHKPFLAPHPKAILPSTIKDLGHVGGMFFMIQIVVLIFQTDNLIIAHFAGTAAVTPYSVAYRLFGYTTLLQGLIFPNLWAAYAEAIARKDIGWVRRTYRSNLALSTLSTVAVAVPLVIVATPFICVWTGEDAAVPPFGLLVCMAGWSVINASMSAVSCLHWRQSAPGCNCTRRKRARSRR